jgi:sialate O-acetylesterase
VTGQSRKEIEIPSIFSDNMVLQQKANVPFFGKAIPGQRVNITSSWGGTSKTKVGMDGSWKLYIKTPKAGGPFSIKMNIGDSIISYKNVMVGEVWLCSGQSNMEIPLEGWPGNNKIANSEEEIRNAKYPMIRLFNVAKVKLPKPAFNCRGSWQECTPENVKSFSSTAYFFGRKLFKELKVPIGLIEAAWGGTPIETWISEKVITQLKDYKDYPSKIEKMDKEYNKFLSWLLPHKSIDVSKRKNEEKWKSLDFGDFYCAGKELNDEKWAKMNVPGYWEKAGVEEFDGVIWFRKHIQIPKNWINKDLLLELGPVDDCDITFVNGQQVGAHEEPGICMIKRNYIVPAGVVKDTILTIAVRILDNFGLGGFWGKNDEMKIGLKDSTEKIRIDGEWKYLPIAELMNDKFYLLDFKENEFLKRPKMEVTITPDLPAVLYNGMIAPLIPYSIKGVIWYQGEANTNNPAAYRTLFPMMIKNWREDWKNDFSFLFAQIAPFRYSETTYSQELRESQLYSLKTPKTGMAVTLDIGDSMTIHPPDKQDVGERLALWALAKNYGQKVQYSGPLYKSFKVSNNKIVLTFEYADGLKVGEYNGKNLFQIADKSKVFKAAKIEIKGNTIIVYSDEVKEPVAVRYAWSNYTKGTLFNKAGLPASSFRTDDWSR